MNTGWIKLYRKITEWEWYDDPVVFRLFIHLLLHANQQAKNWRGTAINSGELITSYPQLARQLTGNQQAKIGVQQIRTAIGKLKSTGEITVKTSNRFSLIKLKNYENYQFTNTPVNSQLTGKQQATNSQLTPNKKDKNNKNEKKDKNIILHSEQSSPSFQDLIKPFLGQYSPLMIQDFSDYWQAKNAGGQKERWQMEKVFDIGRRLATWKRKEEKWQYEKEQRYKKPIEESPRQTQGEATFTSLKDLIQPYE